MNKPCILKLDQKPCNVVHLDQFDRFLVGTYEYFPTLASARDKFEVDIIGDTELEDKLKRLNNHYGKLILIKYDQLKPTIDCEYDCDLGGGVFDLKIEFDLSKAIYHIYVAHSNGTVGHYEVSKKDDLFRFELKSHSRIHESAALTSIDLIKHSSGKTNSFVANQKGDLSLVQSDGSIEKCINIGDHEIWQVKSIRISSTSCIIVLGAENCSWHIYHYREEDGELNLIYENKYKDFNAGVTSIYVLDSNLSENICSIKLLLGSYDETIQTYMITLDINHLTKIHVCRTKRTRIEGGGIWRMKASKSNRRKLYLAAMYAGTFQIEFKEDIEGQIDSKELENSTKKDNIIKLLKTGSLNTESAPLHYDVDESLSNPSICIVDFDNRLCIFIPVGEQCG